MDKQLLTRSDRRKRRRDGIVNSALGVVAIPTVMSFWTPWPWIAAWMTVYALFAVYGILNPFGQATLDVEWRWSVSVGICMCFVPISAAIWSDFRDMRWLVAVVIAIYVALESATLPHLGLTHWRVGPLLTVPTMALCMLTVANFGAGDALVGVAFIAAMLVLIDAGAQSRDRNVSLHDKQRELEEQITKTRHLADHDSLTSVHNRRGITAQIAHAVQGPATLVMFDADRFKSINDTTGHSVGDAVLVQIATQLGRRLGDNWKIGRLGGDEFVAVASGVIDLPEDLASPIVCVVKQEPFVHRFEVGMSAGALQVEETATVDDALAHVGFAMRAAKRHGGGLSYFSGDLQRRWERGLEIGGAVSGADTTNTIVPYAQIIVRNGRPIGCELLARWRCLDGEVRGPGDFLPLLIDKGLMPELNRRMIAEAVAFAARFNDLANPPFVSVNVTAQYLAAPDLVGDLLTLLSAHKVGPGRLMIEITESERLGQIDWETSVRDLRALGVLLAIDDLGAGYSSIERMASLPITHLKFDMAFAQRVRTPFGEVMRGITLYALKTGVGVIAEGIETEDQAKAMADIGVDNLQGFLYSRPQPLPTIEESIRDIDKAPSSVELRASRS